MSDLYFGMQSNMKDRNDFSLYVEVYSDGQANQYNTTEGIAIIFDEEQNSLRTVGAMSTVNMERALKHIYRSIIQSYMQGEDDVEMKGCMLLDNLDFILNEMIGNKEGE